MCGNRTAWLGSIVLLLAAREGWALDEKEALWIAQGYLDDHAEELGLDDTTSLRPPRTRQLDTTWAFEWQQELNGLDVLEATVGVTVSDRLEKVVSAGTSLVPEADGKALPTIDEWEAVDETRLYLGEPERLGAAVLGLAYVREEREAQSLRLVYLVDAEYIDAGLVDRRMVAVDAEDWTVIGDESLLSHAYVEGQVHGPVYPTGPTGATALALMRNIEVDLLNNPAIQNSDDGSFWRFDGLVGVEFDVRAFLRGDYYRWDSQPQSDLFWDDVEDIASNTAENVVFFPDTQHERSAVNIYYWLSEHRKHLANHIPDAEATLDTMNLIFNVRTATGGNCNAGTSGSTKIYFGTANSCINADKDPGFDAEIVLHEHAHALQSKFSFTPNFGGEVGDPGFELREALADVMGLLYKDLGNDDLFGRHSFGLADLRTRELWNDFTTFDWEIGGVQGREVYAGALWEMPAALGSDLAAEQVLWEALRLSPRADTGEGLLLNLLTALGCDVTAGECPDADSDVVAVRDGFAFHEIGADAYVRDGIAPSPWDWFSGDVWLAVGGLTASFPETGVQKNVGVNVRSRDNSYGFDDFVVDPVIDDLEVHVYYAKASTDPRFPADWTEVAASPDVLPTLAAGDTELITIPWTPTVAGPYSLLVRLVSPCDADTVESDCDPLVHPDNDYFYENNIALNSSQRVLGRANAPAPPPTQTFTVRVPNNTASNQASVIEFETSGGSVQADINVPVAPGTYKEVEVMVTFITSATPASGRDARIRIRQKDNQANFEEVVLPSATKLPGLFALTQTLAAQGMGGFTFEIP